MINKHRSKDVEIMLKSILSNKIKVWSLNYDTYGKRIKRREKKQNYKIINFKYPENDQYFNCGDQEFCYGHFRWNFGKGYILNDVELKRVKEYFKL